MLDLMVGLSGQLNCLAIVFLMFSMNPETAPRDPIKCKAFPKDSKSAQNKLVSSANWLNFISFWKQRDTFDLATLTDFA